MKSKDLNQLSFLIIGGTQRAGTTSLYKYLSDHPGVCASAIKETRFFLDKDYPLPSADRFNGENLDVYGNFFKRCGDMKKIRVEATPDYLYSETALKIADLLPQAKMVFILRDPVDRMISWYKYARQRGLLDDSISFEQYVKMQYGVEITKKTPVHLRALEHGNYDKYLKRFYEKMKERILVIRFENLRESPLTVMKTVCSFAGLNGEFYNNYNFTIENASYGVLNWKINRIYNDFRRRVSYALHDRPLLRKVLKLPNQLIKKILSFNKKSDVEIFVPEELASLIRYGNLDINKGME